MNNAHDPLLRDIFTPLWLGATLCIPDREDIETPGQLAHWMEQQKVSIAHLTPAMAQLLTETTPDSDNISTLRYAFFGGDLLTKRDVTRIRKLAPSATCVNFYGATETPQAMGYFLIPNPSEQVRKGEPASLKESVPLGRGIEGAQLLVLNAAQQLAGVGEVGEIYVRTPYLAQGYMGDEKLTQERFIVNPFTKTSDSPQASEQGLGKSVSETADRLYKTGDLARYLPDGNIEFLGRIDNQVKIRGFRIELGEIESLLSVHDQIQQAVVIAREDLPGDKRLVAYIVTSSESLTSSQLRQFLKQKLPEYMLPSAFVLLENLPLTPNGKVDRRGLPAPDPSQWSRTENFVAPSTPIEQQLSEIWVKVLDVERVGIHDNFFELGGHSLLATQMLSRIREVFAIELPLRTLFESPTVAELATGIDQQKQDPNPTQELPAIAPFSRQRRWVKRSSLF